MTELFLQFFPVFFGTEVNFCFCSISHFQGLGHPNFALIWIIEGTLENVLHLLNFPGEFLAFHCPSALWEVLWSLGNYLTNVNSNKIKFICPCHTFN